MSWGREKGEKAALTTTASRVYFAQLFKVSSQAALKMTHTLVNTEKIIKTVFPLTFGPDCKNDVLISNLEFFTKLTNAFFFSMKFETRLRMTDLHRKNFSVQQQHMNSFASFKFNYSFGQNEKNLGLELLYCTFLKVNEKQHDHLKKKAIKRV